MAAAVGAAPATSQEARTAGGDRRRGLEGKLPGGGGKIAEFAASRDLTGEAEKPALPLQNEAERGASEEAWGWGRADGAVASWRGPWQRADARLWK